MNILYLLQGDGIKAKRMSGTNGGEYSSACPGCGGVDRFRCWPEQGEDGRWWCRQCAKCGDLIQYLREFRGMGYREACQQLGRESPAPGFDVMRGSRLKGRPMTKWTPRETSFPPGNWQEKASSLVSWAHEQLMCARHEKTRRWLRGRGLTEETIAEAQLGWNPGDAWRRRATWDLPEAIKENGRPKKLWIPAGIVIPTFRDSRVIRVRIRRPGKAAGPKYYFLPGSSSAPMVLGQRFNTVVVVESELDGILLKQEAGSLADIVALGSAQARPDAEAAERLSEAARILVALDSDEAGAKEAWRWWATHFPKAKRWPIVDGKDPAEAFQNGCDLRAWVEAGLQE